MTWVWDNSPAEGTELLLLLALADHASDDGADAWPSVATLARKCRVHPRTVQRLLRKLDAAGLISVEPNAGRVPGRTQREQPNLYRVVMDTPRQIATTPPATEAAPPWQMATDPPGAGATRITLLEPPLLEPTRAPADNGFAAFWQLYPRGDGKPAAAKAWAQAVKVAEPERIMEGLQPWLVYWQQRAEPEFVPWAQKWLRQQQFFAAPPAARRQVGQRAPITADREAPEGRVVDL